MKTNKLLQPTFFIKRNISYQFLLVILFYSSCLFGQWQPFSLSNELPSYGSFKDVFVYENTIWIISGDGAIHKSLDNGQTWIAYNANSNTNKVYFLDDLRGYAVGDYGYVGKTVDGGENWTAIYNSNVLGYNNINDVYFNGERGWFIGREGIIYQTEDGGVNWSSVSLPSVPAYFLNLTDIFFYDDLEGYIVGYGNGYFKTIDGGQTWRYHRYLVNGLVQTIYLQSIFFKNQLEGWGTNGRDTYKTIDGGTSWERFPIWKLGFAKEIYFLTEQLGWAFHNVGDISRTIDGGINWTKEKEDGQGYSLNRIIVDNKGNGWAVGDFHQLFIKPHQPEINISNGATFINNKDTIPDFVDSTDFGTPLETFTRTFTIFNSFTDTLILKNDLPAELMGSLDFQVIQQPADTILAGDTTQFIIEYTPSGSGAFAKILIENNSFRDSLFEFHVQGNCVDCIIEGHTGVCDSTENLTYRAPAGMTNYFWQLQDNDAEIIGPNNEQSVIINVKTLSTTLEVVFEEPNGCRRKCTKDITVGLSIDEDCSPSMSGVRTVCPNTDSIRYTTPKTYVIVNGVFNTSYYALANSYKWEIVSGDATIQGVDSLYEVFVKAGTEDYELQLTIMNYPDCAITCSEFVDVQSVDELGICGQVIICEDTENAFYSATDNMKSYHWEVSNKDSTFFEDSTGLAFISVNQLEEDFNVRLAIETNIGCLFEDELMVNIADNCAFQLNKIIYVNANLTTGLGNGTSWINAFKDLQAALDIAENQDQIWVAKGIYKPSKDRIGTENPLDSESVTFYIDKEIQLFGGFLGNEATLTERAIETNETILSGDLNGDDELINDLLDNNFPAKNKEENANSIIHIGNGGKHTRLDGFIIQSGNADLYQNYNIFNEKNTGAGVYLEGNECGTGGSVTIENCLFRYNNAVQWGSGIAALSSDRIFISPNLKSCQFTHNNGGGLGILNTIPIVIAPTIDNCQFIENRGGNGGALYLNTLAGENKATFNHCTFGRNRATYGGAIYSYLNGLKTVSSPSFYDCKIIGNDMIYGYGQGGGVYIKHEINYIPQTRPDPVSFPHFERVLFQGNKSSSGGAVYTECSYRRIQPYYINCVFVKNESIEEGSVIYNKERNGTNYSFFYNTTTAFNKTTNGGTFYNEGAYSIFTNSLIWRNLGKIFSNQIGNSFYISHTLTEENTCPQGVDCGEGNIFGQDPIFIDTLSNFGVQFNSPVIDTGANIITLREKTFDLDFAQNPRITAGRNADTLRIDIGAYEFQNTPILSIAYDAQLTHIPTAYIFADTFYENDSSTYTFIIKNVGSQLLSFAENPVAQMTGDTNFHIIQETTKTELTLSAIDSFKIQFNAVEPGIFETTIELPYNSFNNEPYEFILRMNVMPRPDTPRLTISLLTDHGRDLRDSILRDTLCYKFGSEYSFQMENKGTGTLYYGGNEKINLQGNNYPQAYSVSLQPSLDSLSVGEKDTFRLSYQSNGIHSRNNSVQVVIPFNGVELGDSPYKFHINTHAAWCPDTTLIAVYSENKTEALFAEILIDTICWGESQNYFFKIKNIGEERLFFKENSSPIQLDNSNYQIKSNPALNLNADDSTNFEITFTVDEPGTYETEIIISYYAQNGVDYRFKLRTVVLPYDTPNQQTFCDGISTGVADRLVVAIKDSIVVLGDEFCVPVYIGNLDKIYYLSTKLDWDKNVFTYKGFNNLNLPVNNNIGLNIIGDTSLHLIWYDYNFQGIPFSKDKPSFELCFQARKIGNTQLRLRDLEIFNLDGYSDGYLMKSGNFVITEPLPICENDILLDEFTNLKSTYYQAEEMIQATVKIDSAMSVVFQAEETIILRSGFQVEYGANFAAEIKEITCEEPILYEEASQRGKIISSLDSFKIDLTIAPNPFYQSTRISYNLPKDSEVSLQIFSMNGQLVKTLVPQQNQVQGNYEYIFEPNTNLGNVYFAILITETEVLTKKMIFIK